MVRLTSDKLPSMGDLGAERDAILAACYGFRSSALIFAAFELRVFEHVPPAGAQLGELGEACGVPPDRLHHLLGALVAVNLLAVRGDRYVIPEPLPGLLRAGPGYIGDLVLNARREYQHWLHAAEIVGGRYQGPAFAGETLDPAIVAPTLDAIEQSNRAAADSMWPHLERLLPDVRDVLDVGAGHGYYTEGLLRRAPHARVTMFDLPQVIAHARARHADSPRIAFVAGDVRQLDRDQEFDLVLLNDLLVYFDRDQKIDVLRRACRALRGGGTLAMVNQKLDDDGATPRRWALFSWRIFVQTGRGHLAPDRVLEKLVREAGLASVDVIALNDERTLITAVRRT
jgi:ubiquinone/menaquinone biosynthesis C-methylase UbiE